MSLVRPETSVDATVPEPGRSIAIDRLRGLAIALMILDHLSLVFSGPPILRLTLGRVAMPLFFILSGHLVRRVGWRHYALIVVGAALPLVVPWIDDPNVLVLYVMGAGVLVLFAAFGWSPWWLLIFAAGAAANGYYFKVGTGYDALQLVALMALGALLPRAAFDLGARLPAGLGAVGRFPVSIYVGHLLALQLVATVLV